MTRLSYRDLMLPSQTFLRREFKGDEDQLFDSMLHLIADSTDLIFPVDDFDLVGSERFSTEEMASHPISLRLLQFLIKLSRSEKVLEVGSFIGLSAMSMARALPKGGSLITIEKFSEFAEICRQNFDNNSLTDKITLLEGDAMEVLPELLGQTFDFVFLDGNKELYAEYFQLLDALVKPQGLIVVDNMFCSGDVLNDVPLTEKAEGVRKFLSYVKERKEYSRMLLPVYDGIMLVQKN